MLRLHLSWWDGTVLNVNFRGVSALEIVLIVIVVGAVALLLLKKRTASRSTERRSDSSGGYWDSSMIENKHPGKDWVYLPNVSKENDSYLIFEPNPEQKKAAQKLLQRIINREDYNIELQRQFSDSGELEDISVIDTTDERQVAVGRLDRDAMIAIKERYKEDMPISVFAKSVFKDPDGALHLTMGTLIPKKSLRKDFEL